MVMGTEIATVSQSQSTGLTVGLLTMSHEDVRAFGGMLPSEVRAVLRETTGVKGNALSRAVGAIVGECRQEGNAMARLVLDQYCERGGILARPVIGKSGNLTLRGGAPVKIRQSKSEADLVRRLESITGKRVTFA